MSGFTPGPWFVDALGIESIGSVETADGDSIAQAQARQPLAAGRPDAERAANARLISAAPELLAALVECFDEELCGDRNADNATRETDFYRPVISWATRHRARAAIAKALGTTPNTEERP